MGAADEARNRELHATPLLHILEFKLKTIRDT
jgi:hypothetical protein